MDYSNYLDVHVYTDMDHRSSGRSSLDHSESKIVPQKKYIYEDMKTSSMLNLSADDSGRGQNKGYTRNNYGPVLMRRSLPSNTHKYNIAHHREKLPQQQQQHQTHLSEHQQYQHNETVHLENGKGDDDYGPPIIKKRYKYSTSGGEESAHSEQGNAKVAISSDPLASSRALLHATLSAASVRAGNSKNDVANHSITRHDEKEIHQIEAPAFDKRSVLNGIDHGGMGQRKKRKQIRGTAYCSLCDKTFQYYSLYRNHMIKHSNHTPYTCHLCQKGFKSKQAIRYHMSTHSRDKQIKCRLCSLSYSTMNQFIAHVLTHESDRIFPCTVCGKIMNSEQKRKDHMSTHTEDRAYICEYCNKTFRQRHHLSLHLTLHRQYCCQNCQKEYRTAEPARRPYICDKCSIDGTVVSSSLASLESSVRTGIQRGSGRAGNRRPMSGNGSSSTMYKNGTSSDNCHTGDGSRMTLSHNFQGDEINPFDIDGHAQIDVELENTDEEEEMPAQQQRGRGRPRRRHQQTEFINMNENSDMGRREPEDTYEETAETGGNQCNDDGQRQLDEEDDLENDEEMMEEDKNNHAGEEDDDNLSTKIVGGKYCFFCNYCNCTFKHSAALKQHIRQNHATTE